MHQSLTPARERIRALTAASWRSVVVVVCMVLLVPSVCVGSVQALFNPSALEQAPFPSDQFTIPNPANITQLQVNLPLPDCTVRPTDCNILRVINTLDGFNLDPRLSIPFSGPIDVNSVNSDTIFLVELGDHGRKDRILGINQIVWDPSTNTLHAESDQLLEQHTPYTLVVTDGVHDAAGDPVRPSASFTNLIGEDFDTSQAYLAELSDALDELPNGKGRLSGHVVAASIFTTRTVTGVPVVQRTNDIYFDLVIPSGPKPPNGWPVAIFGHGATSGKDAVFFSAAKMASHGIATIGINAVGHGCGQTGLGCGPLSTFTVTQSGGSSVTFLEGGRGIDQDGDGDFKLTEGLNATPPRGIISSTDGIRQTVVDLMQLVRVIQVGMDVHGSGTSDLDSSRIYYFGQSLGGIYGTVFLAVEPHVRVGVPNVAGGPLIDTARLSPVNRKALGASLAASVPPLINIGGADFNENLPLRDEPPLINTVPGADAIQQRFDENEWVAQPGNPVAYAPYIRKEPLEHVPGKSTIFQFAKGDEQVPNPTTTGILRAGELADVATYYRNDLAVAADPLVPNTPHTFLLRVPPRPFDSTVYAIAFDAQEQIAAFFESDGDTVINPDPAFFEVPIVQPLPETCNFLFPLPPPSPPFPSYLFFPSCP